MRSETSASPALPGDRLMSAPEFAGVRIRRAGVRVAEVVRARTPMAIQTDEVSLGLASAIDMQRWKSIVKAANIKLQ